MTRNVVLLAALLGANLAATMAGYAAGQQTRVTSSTDAMAGQTTPPPLWTPPSFDVQTSPPIESQAPDRIAPAWPVVDGQAIGDEAWSADESAAGSRPDANH